MNEKVEIGGETFRFNTPKMALVISGLMRIKQASEDIDKMTLLAEMQGGWVRKGIGKEAWAHLESRLEDDDDPLDWPDIVKAFQDTTSGDAERPTTSSPASSAPSLATTESVEKPSPQGSIFGD